MYLLRACRNLWHNVRGLITVADLLGVVGFWLYKGTVRRTMAVGIGLLAVAVFGGKLGANVTLKSAVTGTGLIMLISCIGGIIMMRLGGSFSKRDILVAEAKGSNLLEDMKKSRAQLHADALWRCVFAYEQQQHSPQAVEREQQLLDEHRDDLQLHLARMVRAAEEAMPPKLGQVLGQLGLTEEGWHVIFDYAVLAPINRSVMRERLRYDLAKVKDWYDGAPFHQTDTKLQEQFHGSDNLREAQRIVDMGWRFYMTNAWDRLRQGAWLQVLTRAIQIRVSQSCRRLDERYPDFGFYPDHFLWPSNESHELVRAHLGERALHDLITIRQHLFELVFSPEDELAHDLMNRAVYPNFDAATALRKRFDPDYLLGDLTQSWLDDMHRYNRALDEHEKRVNRRQRMIDDARQRQGLLDDYLAEQGGIVAVEDPRTMRVVRVGVHIDYNDVTNLLRKRAAGETIDRDPQLVLQDIARKRDYFTRLLLAVRLHHTLTRLELEDYEFYLNRILSCAAELPPINQALPGSEESTGEPVKAAVREPV